MNTHTHNIKTNLFDSKTAMVAICLLAFMLSFCSLVYELQLASLISKLTGDPIIWETTSIGVFIASLGIGLLIYARRAPASNEDHLRRLVTVEFWLSVSGGLACFVILFLHLVYRIYLYDLNQIRNWLGFAPVTLFGVASQLPVMIVGILSGFEFPILYSILKSKVENPTGLTLFFYYLGALAATLVFGLWFLPQISPYTTAIIIACFNLTICFATSVFIDGRRCYKMLVPIVSVAATFAILVKMEPKLQQLHMRNYYYNKLHWWLPIDGPLEIKYPHGIAGLVAYLADFPEVERHISPYHNIDIVPEGPSRIFEGQPGNPAQFALHMDGRFQFSPINSSDYHEHLIHVPIQVNRQVPEEVLVLGGGDGLAVRELLKYGDRIKTITLIDMDQVIIALAQQHPRLTVMNESSLKNPKISIFTEDAFKVLRNKKMPQFDAIFIDFTYPFNFDSARLYSAEFFALVAQKLKDNGFVAKASPIAFDSFDNYANVASQQQMIVSTFHMAGLIQPLLIKGGNSNYLVARRQPKNYEISFVDQGIVYKSLSPDFFIDHNFQQLSVKIKKNAVNSLLKPTFFGIEDTFF